MHKKMGNKGYDQSVTCLADDSQNLGGLVVARFALREFYRKQTVAYIRNQAKIHR